IILSSIILSILYIMLAIFSDITRISIPVIETIAGCTVLLIINILGLYLPIRKFEYTSTTDLIRNKE
ncbi:MAG: hypothetical protein ACRDD7_11595, partial [Peptostreptococcaceae bacterium]